MKAHAVMLARVVVCLSVVATGAAVAQSTRPAGLTQRDRVTALAASYRHTLVDAYAADGTPKGAWDAAAKTFLDRMAVRFAEAGVDVIYKGDLDVSPGAMRKLADALDGCDNPLVNYCRAVIYRDGGDADAYATLLRAYGPKVVAGPYPTLRRYSAAVALARSSPRSAKPAAECDALLTAMLLEKPVDPADRRMLYRRVLDDVWERPGVTAARRKALIDTLAADPKADAWLLDVLRGVDGVDAAWEARGTGFANTVTDAGRAGFHKHIAQARVALTAAYALEPTYPEAATQMITVCMAEDGRVDDARVWFDRATAAQIDYMTAWQSYANTLEPRWGGSLDAMQALGHEAVATKRFDTVVPEFEPFVLGMMSKEQGAGDGVYRRPGVWADVSTAFDGYLKPAAHGVDVAWIASRRAAYAYLCGQYAEALRTLDALGGRANAEAFKPFDLSPAGVRADCAAKTGAIKSARE